MGLTKAFLDALKSVFGSTGNIDIRVASAGAFEAVLSVGPTELYDISGFFGTSDLTKVISLIDATATGLGSPVIISIRATGFGFRPFRPTLFNRGLVLNFTSTGTSADWVINTLYSPRSNVN